MECYHREVGHDNRAGVEVAGGGGGAVGGVLYNAGKLTSAATGSTTNAHKTNAHTTNAHKTNAHTTNAHNTNGKRDICSQYFL